MVARANIGHGVRIGFNSPLNTIGEMTALERNLISGNVNGVLIVADGPANDGNTVIGNYIGTDITGMAAIPNIGDGVRIISLFQTGVTNNSIVGGSTAGARNVISGNSNAGVSLHAGANNTTVSGNYIGTDATGTTAIPNMGDGVNVDGLNSTIGGTALSERNVISGNGSYGVSVIGGTGNKVLGNYIGTDASGAAGLGNALGGIAIFSVSSIVGGASAGARNIISGNNKYGVLIGIGGSSLIQGNYIGTKADGTAALGNSQHGVYVLASGSTIGGLSPDSGNRIQNNGGAGVFVAASFVGAGTANSIRGNSIVANTGLGIDLGSPGVLPNDPSDVDSGPNNSQNYPVLTSVSGSNGTTTIRGKLNR